MSGDRPSLSERSRGTLGITEIHPSALDAEKWIMSLNTSDLFLWQETFASCSTEDNRLAEICSETLRRLLNGEPVSDRYLLGLAWVISKNYFEAEIELLRTAISETIKENGRLADGDNCTLLKSKKAVKLEAQA